MRAHPQHLVTAKQAAQIAGVHPATLLTWVRKGWISAVRVGEGPYRYDPDEVAAMRVKYPCPALDERIRELVEAAPEITAKQINRIRLLLHTAPDTSNSVGIWLDAATGHHRRHLFGG